MKRFYGEVLEVFMHPLRSALNVDEDHSYLLSSCHSLRNARAEVRRQISGQVAQPIERTDTNTLVYKVDQACVSMR
jgi:hypothetical protein